MACSCGRWACCGGFDHLHVVCPWETLYQLAGAIVLWVPLAREQPPRVPPSSRRMVNKPKIPHWGMCTISESCYIGCGSYQMWRNPSLPPCR